MHNFEPYTYVKHFSAIILKSTLKYFVFQDDLQLYSKRADSELIGFVDMGEECNKLYNLRHGK